MVTSDPSSDAILSVSPFLTNLLSIATPCNTLGCQLSLISYSSSLLYFFPRLLSPYGTTFYLVFVLYIFSVHPSGVLGYPGDFKTHKFIWEVCKAGDIKLRANRLALVLSILHILGKYVIGYKPIQFARKWAFNFKNQKLMLVKFILYCCCCCCWAGEVEKKWPSKMERLNAISGQPFPLKRGKMGLDLALFLVCICIRQLHCLLIQRWFLFYLPANGSHWISSSYFSFSFWHFPPRSFSTLLFSLCSPKAW